MGNISIADLKLPPRTEGALRRNGIETVAALVDLDRLDLWRLRGVGAKRQRWILEALAGRGLKLRGAR